MIALPSATNTETSRQWAALAPKVVRYAGANYRKTGIVLYDNATSTVRFDYSHKPRGALTSSKVSFAVRYDGDSDLYDITTEHFDGVTFASTTLHTTEGATFDAFSRLELLIGSHEE